MEIYKDVIGYEGIYKVSNLGNVKTFRYKNERQMKLCKDKDGYLQLGLSKDGLVKTVKVHQLVAESFLNHKRCGLKLVVNHIDFNKANNKVENLEIVTARENSNRKHIKSSSKYTGVTWDKNRGKWISQIFIENKKKFLGRFENELEASKAYELRLFKL
jgi:hypothetical protein